MRKKIGVVGLTGSILYGGGLALGFALIVKQALAGKLVNNPAIPPEGNVMIAMCLAGLVLIAIWAFCPRGEEEPGESGSGR